MANSKRFQSGREIFEHYISSYVPDRPENYDLSSRADELADEILSDFAAGVHRRSQVNPDQGG